MRRLFLFVAILFLIPASTFAKGYSAQRFDVTLRPLDDGAVQVTETLRLTFEGGPFSYVSREISLKKTDGIEILGASMDGRVQRRGTDPGQFEVRVSNARISIRWHFAGASDSTHDFRLSYLAHGVVQQTGAGPLLEWQAHPTEHAYRIASSRIVVDGLPPDREPALRTRRVGQARAEHTGGEWVIEADDIGSNGWVTISAPTIMAAGIVPKWQQHEREQRALAPRLLQFAALATVLSLAVVLLLWRQYPPAPAVDPTAFLDGPPVVRPPAIAAAILAGGHATTAPAAGTLFDLASRNALAVAEAERNWKTRRGFVLTRNDGIALAPHEAALMDVMFKRDRSVSLSKAASGLARRGRVFRHAVNEELLRLGLTDEQRRANRRRLFVAGLSLVALSIAAVMVVLAKDAAPWGLAIPLGLDIAAILAIVLAATRVELSDEGYRERERWKGFRRTLKGSMGSMGSSGSIGSESLALRFLPYLAAMGLGTQFSRYLKKRGGDAILPPWFRTLAGSDGSAAFAAFVGAMSASTSAGAAGSGAAGGGSSSAG
jgi:hypothetical protein